MRTRARKTLALVLLALAAACARPGDRDPKPARAERVRPRRDGAPAPGAASATAPDAHATGATAEAAPLPTGRVHGTVRLAKSTQVRLKRLTNDVDVATCGEIVTADALVVGRTGGLANVVIEARSPSGGVLAGMSRDGSASPARLDLAGCKLEPHVQVVSAGSPLELRNVDGLLHEVVTVSTDNVPIRESLPRYRRLRLLGPAHLARPERVRVSCDRHPWSAAWVHVSEHRALAVTGADGAFTLEGLPTGEVVLEAWHESLAGATRTAVVPAEGEVAVDFELR